MASIIEMPKLSDTMSVGTVVKWHKKKGDEVVNGDVLAEIETDKATMELENFDDGVLLEIFVQEGNEAPIGSPLAAVGEADEEIPVLTSDIPPKDNLKNIPEAEAVEIENEADLTANAETDEQPTPEEGISSSEPLNISSTGAVRIFASPLAKKIAKDENIDLASVTGTGPNGRIVKKDLQGVESTALTTTSPNRVDQGVVLSGLPSSNGKLVEKVIPLSKMRSVIASRLLQSKTTIPHFYLQKEINSHPLRLAREVMNEKLKTRSESDSPLRLTINDLILKACAETIKWIPEINTSWDENGIHFHGNVDLAFGVAVDDGLLTPVIRNAESLPLSEISLQAKSLIGKARDKKLTPEEMSGSTFTVTNLGMFGIDFFSGIINPPNAAILSVGACIQKPIINPAGGIISGETMMLGLSCDHRLVDGAVGARFLKLLAENLECPSSMLI